MELDYTSSTLLFGSSLYPSWMMALPTSPSLTDNNGCVGFQMGLIAIFHGYYMIFLANVSLYYFAELALPLVLFFFLSFFLFWSLYWLTNGGREAVRVDILAHCPVASSRVSDLIFPLPLEQSGTQSNPLFSSYCSYPSCYSTRSVELCPPDSQWHSSFKGLGIVLFTFVTEMELRIISINTRRGSRNIAV